MPSPRPGTRDCVCYSSGEPSKLSCGLFVSGAYSRSTARSSPASGHNPLPRATTIVRRRSSRPPKQSFAPRSTRCSGAALPGTPAGRACRCDRTSAAPTEERHREGGDQGGSPTTASPKGLHGFKAVDLSRNAEYDNAICLGTESGDRRKPYNHSRIPFSLLLASSAERTRHISSYSVTEIRVSTDGLPLHHIGVSPKPTGGGRRLLCAEDVWTLRFGCLCIAGCAGACFRGRSTLSGRDGGGLRRGLRAGFHRRVQQA